MMHSLTHSTDVGYAIALLKLEANAIDQAANRIDRDSLEAALKLLAHCSGKVVLTGVGKSGIVAKKIAATLCSIGTVALFLHPCEALHGDLGIVTSADVVMLLSNSGETEELLAMLPHLKHRDVSLIAILGNLNSTLASQVDVVLDATVDREACPLNLAPTTSTTVALAIGDAIAMTLMQMRGLTQEEFALNHPAGRLGKRLTLRVADVMHSADTYPKLSPEASWLEIVSAIGQGGLGAVSIVDVQGYLLGLITDGDLRRWIEKVDAIELNNLTAHQMMTLAPVVTTADTLAYDALKLMEERPSQISVLPVVDPERHCLGLIRLHDIIRSGL